MPIPFSAGDVDMIASAMSKRPYEVPSEHLAEAWANLGYNRYRDIRFRRERAIWRGERRGFELQVLPAGWIFERPVDIYLVDDGQARPIQPDNSLFEFGLLAGAPPRDVRMPFSGFRLTAPINRRGVFDEIAVFQGASYFRAVSRRQVYGLSARGLAIDTGQPKGEEFPFFRTFWIETPRRGARHVLVHALLDSPSTTGAYTFRISAGAPTTMDVDARLYPRRDGMQVGLAPLTSMFLFSPIDRSRISDFRRGVHDSDGLAVVDGAGEHVWRPLTNPKRLQISEFMVGDLAGFGLIQRARTFGAYGDLEANYQRRPSAWVEPTGHWGGGSVVLVEIPSEEEIHDNIVAYWRPKEPYKKSEAYRFGYRLLWPDTIPLHAEIAKVVGTASGLANGAARKSGAVRYAVDFRGPSLWKLRGLPEADLSSSAGRTDAPVVQRNLHTGGVRVDFLLRPEGAEMIELRLQLKSHDKAISEVWLSRWTK